MIDSGVDAGHPVRHFPFLYSPSQLNIEQDFRGRAFQIQSFVPGSNIDDNGHGTHVAGTVGSHTFGVAKRATILGVKVLRYDNSGEWSYIIAGMDFVHKDAPKRRGQCPNGFVVNMSLGGGRTQAVNDAARALVNAGFFVAVAAGNNNQDARNYSPASEPAVCTVGGTSKYDTRYAMSNWGPALDILGPGVEVLSTFPGGRTVRICVSLALSRAFLDTCFLYTCVHAFVYLRHNITLTHCTGQATLSGTSMATPHIAGLGAYFATLQRRIAGPWLCAEIQRLATKNVIKDQVANTVNLLAFNGAT